MEKAKETRAPPPAVRNQPSVDLGSSMMQEKALPPIPPQRGDFGQSKGSRMNPAAQRPQEDMIRSVNSTLQSTAKLPPKRPLPQDSEDHHARPTLQRNGPSYQQEHQSKRRRTSEDFDDDEDMTEDHPKMTAPPIRQSSSRQKVLWSLSQTILLLTKYRICQPSHCSQVVMRMPLRRAICKDRHL